MSLEPIARFGTKRIKSAATSSYALFSPCENYRYFLERDYNDLGSPAARAVNFIMMNPSTADYQFNDPTVHRCEKFALKNGFRFLRITNIFAYRSTAPELLRGLADPIGSENDDNILAAASDSELVIAAWGQLPVMKSRGLYVANSLLTNGIKLQVLKRNKDGSPAHPLYLRGDAEPQNFVANIC